MKLYFSLIITLLLAACGGSAKNKTPTTTGKGSGKAISLSKDIATLDEIQQHFQKLIVPQNKYHNDIGRWCYNINTLVRSDFLDAKTADVITGKHILKGWKIVKQEALPFPDEDFSWCFTAHGPKGRIILVTHSGMWERQDGKFSTELDSLPPQKPWKQVN